MINSCCKKYISFILFLFIPISFNGQKTIKLQGIIIDTETKPPLQFASIEINGSKLATISNQNGEFNLNIPLKLSDEKIFVSYLGYKSKVISVKNGIGKYMKIGLTILPVSLNPVNVKYLTAQEIILGALQGLSKNYLDKPANIEAFYIEDVKENDSSIQYIELVLEIYKGCYSNKKDKDRIRIKKGREEEKLKESKFFNYMYFINGPFEALQLDLAKYPRSFIHVLQTSTNFLHPKHFKYFEYQLTVPDINHGEKPYYLINFKPLKNRALLEGAIVIEKESMAITSVEFFLNAQKQKKAMMIESRNEIFLNKNGLYTESKDYHCKVEFCKYKEKFVLCSSKMTYSFLFIDANKGDTSKISNDINLIITSVETKNAKRFRNRDRLWKGVSLSKQIGNYDPEFWRNFKEVKPITLEKLNE